MALTELELASASARAARLSGGVGAQRRVVAVADLSEDRPRDRPKTSMLRGRRRARVGGGGGRGAEGRGV